MDLDEYRTQSLETWGRMSTGWVARRDWLTDNTAPVRDWILDHLRLASGQTLLELAGGTGDLGIAIAERAGDTRLILTDFAPEMVDAARELTSSRGISAEHRVLDAEHMDLDDDSVDAVVCKWGYMLMADPAAALAETRRILRGDGQLTFVVWAAPDRNPWAAIPGMTLVQRGHVPPPEPGAPGIFAMSDPARVRELVTGAGFAEPQIDEIPFVFHYADADDVWGALIGLAGPLARVIAGLDDDERDATRAAIIENVAGLREEDGSYRVPAMSLGVQAR